MYENLFKIITEKVVLTERDTDLVKKHFEPIVCFKNQVLELEGKIPQYLYFIVSGFIRLCYHDTNGNEVTTHINCPSGFITSYIHFINQTKATENVICITDCDVLRIKKIDLEHIIQSSEAFKDFSIWVFQQSIAYNENRSKELATLTAEQRYQQLMDNYPQILHNVPLQYIASFLGMNSKSLSRIRKQMIR
jgi:CRP/FNR family transcriptional regulator, anaerobic regulatory protein